MVINAHRQLKWEENIQKSEERDGLKKNDCQRKLRCMLACGQEIIEDKGIYN
ncbi:hypothetical protein GCM10025794_37490 [Massilia kyonggiensis]